MTDIFLSYSREDQATARHYADALQREGFSVWWDQVLKSGDAYDRVTEEALRTAKAVVVLWSRNSVDSRWVRSEATTADRRGTLRPAMIEPCERPVMFELTHTAELSHWRGQADDPAWKAFVADLKGALRQERVAAPGEPDRAARPKSPVAGRRWKMVAASLAVLVILAAAAWGWRQVSGARQARSVLIPQIAKLVDSGDIAKAFALANQARRYAPDDPLLKSLTPLFSAKYAVATSPVGAEVSVRPYGAASDSWQHLGSTPLAIDMPRSAMRWRFEKTGFETVERTTSAVALENGNGAYLDARAFELNIPMTAVGVQPANTVLVPTGQGLDMNIPAITPVIPAFYVDRHEVTNTEFKAFVDAGGYERRSLWEGLDIRRDGKSLSIEQALRLFVDATGRPGPATWELGSYPEGKGDFPVTGVSCTCWNGTKATSSINITRCCIGAWKT